MRGFYEESPEVKAGRELRRAAERFCGSRLLGGFVVMDDPEWTKLTAAAVAYAAATTYAEALRPKRKKKP